MIQEAKLIEAQNNKEWDGEEDVDSSTMIPSSNNETLKPTPSGTSNTTSNGTSASSSTANTTSKSGTGTARTIGTSVSDVESDLGTLIINSESDEDECDKTLKPVFMQHFERTERLEKESSHQANDIAANNVGEPMIENAEDATLRTLNTKPPNSAMNSEPASPQHQVQRQSPHHSPYPPMSRAIMLEGDFEFLRYLSLDELKARMANLDHEMENEIEELRRRYAAKRQPILDAIDQKRKRQQNF
ncbi:serine/threonine-protein kinase 3-like protein [Dinothrombium tinctorium]|uniref:Serine/threonine-protein kinase 3-like protein n=1 Tax=Dinothrombium tinctorium TaxID=1965070 RepID=A0A3S3NNR1_9ACAR|nr:serine/threonine-protein kinase 3-like protein [Dinothrombium tinctorium]